MRFASHRTLVALLSCSPCSLVLASEPQASALPTVTVTANQARSGDSEITGFADTPAWQLPMQVQRYSAAMLDKRGAQRLADLVSLDASVSDAYDAQGYWDILSVRGFTLDNAYNYRREGLPINAETSIPLDNKAAIDVLKGTSGMQAGVSAPGALVNLLVKRPEGHIRSATVALTGGRSLLAALDLSDRFGPQQAVGLRINAAQERLDPSANHAQGHRQLLALASDLRVQPGTVLEFEIEQSRRSQPSVTGLSLLGPTLPSPKAFDPNLNLNHQSWSLPVVMDATTGTARWRQALAPGWTLVGTLGSQKLVSQDRTVFAYGCSPAYADRFCADGRYDAYDFRSEGEVRLTQAGDLALNGQLNTGPLAHQVRAALQRSVHRTSMPDSAFNPIGVGSVYDDSLAFTPDPRPIVPQASRHSRSTEWSLNDQIRLPGAWAAWIGLRHTHLRRDSALSDGSAPPVALEQRFTTPWTALSHTFAPGHQVYVSWGEGVESKDVPYLGGYANEGQSLPAQKSRQIEAGIKAHQPTVQWALNLFQTIRPQTSVDGANRLVLDGQARHRGVEAQLQTQQGAWSLDASAMLLDARRRSSLDTALDGKRPVNVPARTFKLTAGYKVPAHAGLAVQASVVHEGPRMVLEDNSIGLPAWTRLDAGLSYAQTGDERSWMWRLGVANLLNRRAWRESPLQFGHVYLFPMAPRTVTASLRCDF